MKKPLIHIRRIKGNKSSIVVKEQVEKFDMSKIELNSRVMLREWRKYDIIAVIMSVSGLIVSIIEYEISFSNHRTHNNCQYSPNLMLTSFTLVLTLLSTCFICLRYLVQLKFYILQSGHKFNKYYKNLFQQRSTLHASFILELVLLWIFPYPGVDSHFTILEVSSSSGKHRHIAQHSVCYTYSEILLVIMCLRFYFIVKCILNNSSYRDIFANYFCNKFKTRAGFRFSIKSLMANKQWLLIVAIIVPSVLILAEILRIFERPYDDISGLNYSSFSNSLWCLIITMSTLGYGTEDIYPATYGGRLICLLSVLWGGFSLSWVVIILSSWIYLSPEEELALIKILEINKHKYPKEEDEEVWTVPMTSFLSIGTNKEDLEQENHIKGKRVLKTIRDRIIRIEAKLNRLIQLRLKKLNQSVTK